MTPRPQLHDDGSLDPGTPPPLPTPWALLDNVQYQATVDWLDQWVAWLQQTFRIDARTIPTCWPHHADLVIELGALHDAWRAAHHHNSPADRPAVWLDNLPHRLSRIRDRSSGCGCRRGSSASDPRGS